MDLARAADVRRADLEHRGEDPITLDRLLHGRRRTGRVVGVVLGDQLQLMTTETAGLVDLVEVDLHPLADHAERGERTRLRPDEGDLDRLAVGELLGRRRRAVVGRDLEGLAGRLGAVGRLGRLRRGRRVSSTRGRRVGAASGGRVGSGRSSGLGCRRVGGVDSIRRRAAGVVIVVVAARGGDQRQAGHGGQHASDPVGSTRHGCFPLVVGGWVPLRWESRRRAARSARRSPVRATPAGGAGSAGTSSAAGARRRRCRPA